MAGDGLVQKLQLGGQPAARSVARTANARNGNVEAAMSHRFFSLDQNIRGIMGGNFSNEDTVAGTTADSRLHSLPGTDDPTFTLHHSLHNSSFVASSAPPSQYSARSEDFSTVEQQVTPSPEDQYFFIGQDSPSPLATDSSNDNATSFDFAQFLDFGLCSDAPITPPSVKTPEALPTRRRVPLTPTQPSESPQHQHEAPKIQREELYCPAPGAVLFTEYLQTNGSDVHDTPEPPQVVPSNVWSLPPSSAFTFSMARGGGPVTYSNQRPLPTFTPTPLEYYDSFPLPASTDQTAHRDFLPVPVFMPAPGGGHLEYLDSFPQPASTSTDGATRRDVEQEILQAPQPMPPSAMWDIHATPPSSAFSFRMAPDGSSVTPNANSDPFPQSTWSRETRCDIEKHNLALYGQTWSPLIYCRWGGKCLERLEHSEEAIQEHIKNQHNVNLEGKHRLLCLWDGTCKARVNGVSAGEMARHIDTTDGHPMSLVASDVTGWAKRANACTLCTVAFPRSDSLLRHLKIKHGVVMSKKGKK